jgi:hypothetical protein
MRDNSYDRTIERNYLQKWRFLIPEYEAVKAGRSEAFRRVGDFYRHHGTCSQTFRKYYDRYLRSGAEGGRDGGTSSAMTLFDHSCPCSGKLSPNVFDKSAICTGVR